MRLPGFALALALALVLALTLFGCGGGIWIGIDGSDRDGQPPSVSIASAATSVAAGGSLRVIAAAADASGIEEVAFFRRDGALWTRLGSDASEPYEWQVTVPADGRTVLEVFARATDRTGMQADSLVLAVSVLAVSVQP